MQQQASAKPKERAHTQSAAKDSQSGTKQGSGANTSARKEQVPVREPLSRESSGQTKPSTSKQNNSAINEIKSGNTKESASLVKAPKEDAKNLKGSPDVSKSPMTGTLKPQNNFINPSSIVPESFNPPPPAPQQPPPPQQFMMHPVAKYPPPTPGYPMNHPPPGFGFPPMSPYVMNHHPSPHFDIHMPPFHDPSGFGRPPMGYKVEQKPPQGGAFQEFKKSFTQEKEPVGIAKVPSKKKVDLEDAIKNVLPEDKKSQNAEDKKTLEEEKPTKVESAADAKTKPGTKAGQTKDQAKQAQDNSDELSDLDQEDIAHVNMNQFNMFGARPQQPPQLGNQQSYIDIFASPAMPRGGLIPGQRMMIDNPYMMGMGPHRGGPVPYGFHQMHSPYTPLQHGHGMIPGPPPNWQPMLHPPPFFGGPNHYFHPPQLADQHSGGYPLFVQSAQQSNFHPPSHAMNDLDHPDEVIMGDGQTYMQPSEGASYMHENDATMIPLLPHMHHHHAMVPHPHPHRDEMGNLPFYPYAGNYQQLKVPLPPRKEGEAPQFVFWKQAQRIQILRDKRNINEPTRFFTKRRPKYESRVKVAKNRVRSKNGQFQPREEVKTKKSGNMIHKK